ncbi:hypothetical protein ABZ766_33470 [Streptomyces sp. NPDC006670]|uniref:hypothetical protein n=1 Tax=Streptomyces sp. NPDC006670 TaxID=3154476 RepID=UPI0033FD6F29
MSASAPQPAAADGISSVIRLWCNVFTAGGFFGWADGTKLDVHETGYCRSVSDGAGKKVKEGWKKVQGSLLGDVIASAFPSCDNCRFLLGGGGAREAVK